MQCIGTHLSQLLTLLTVLGAIQHSGELMSFGLCVARRWGHEVARVSAFHPAFLAFVVLKQDRTVLLLERDHYPSNPL